MLEHQNYILLNDIWSQCYKTYTSQLIVCFGSLMQRNSVILKILEYQKYLLLGDICGQCYKTYTSELIVCSHSLMQ